MKRRKIVLMILCLLCSLLLTGCYTDMDPWPQSGMSQAFVTPTPAPTAAPTAIPTAAPMAPEEDVPLATQAPGGDAAPGING